MRNALWLVAALAAGCAAQEARDDVAAHVGERYITIGTDALPSIAGQSRLIEMTGDHAVVAVDAQDLEDISEQMHETFHRCGGFMVHESLDDALQIQKDGPRKPIEYTVDRGALVQSLLPKLQEQHIVQTIRELSRMQNRYYQSETGAAASVWLAEKWRSFSDRPDVTIELYDQGYPQKNVILTIPGTTRASEVVVLGGHLDSIAIGGRNSNAPGADDDASGIATLTEIVRVLMQSNYRPERTIKVIAYAAEEVGLRGSLAVVKEFKKRKVNVVGALQLDMTNYQGSDKDIWLMRDFTDAAQNTFLVRLIETYVGATWAFDSCGYACSDHAAWHRAGVPASMPFESRMNQRNGAIHTRGDTLEMSDDNAIHALKFARLGAAYAIELAKGETVATIATEEPDDDAWMLGVFGLLALLAIAYRYPGNGVSAKA
jgi:bacterial leucyl aminopeptidase